LTNEQIRALTIRASAIHRSSRDEVNAAAKRITQGATPPRWGRVAGRVEQSLERDPVEVKRPSLTHTAPARRP
jgi:hypothetical protein